MGSHARMLAALGAVLTLTMALATAATAATSFVRVEGAGLWATTDTALVDRTVVAHPPASLSMTADGHTATCAPNSPVALLNAAVGPSGWAGKLVPTAADPEVYGIELTAVKSVAQPLSGATWSWVAFTDGKATTDVCNRAVADGFEVLFYPRCESTSTPRTDPCYTGGPLQITASGAGSLYETNPVRIVPGTTTPVSVTVIDALTGAALSPATVTTDTGATASTKPPSDDPQTAGTAVVYFGARGDHWARASASGRVPVRLRFCATDGQDGFCGTVLADPSTTPPPGGPGECVTNGHDGQCGTIDTTGPPTHVKEIAQNQVFARKKGPSKLTGTIDVDGTGIKDVRMRLTRVTTARVIVKPKPKKKARKKTAKTSVASAAATKKKPKKKVRYRTVKRCTYWSNATLLFEKAKKCGTKYGKWWQADLGDVPTTFSYSFEMQLPPGKYVLEVQARDVDGHPELAEPGRNVLTFTVK